MSRRRWPVPTDTALDRRSAIARSYRALALQVAPEQCLALDRAAAELGEDSWLIGAPDTTTEGRLLSTAEAAALCQVSESAVRNWASRPEVPVTRYDGGFSRSELLAYKASQRQRRRGHR